ncbi:MAG: hypothetical protein K8U57_27605 [Planctomycetes bacterium]|nr:hypothetical protein [Planctomycetota bacterium]
MSRGLVEAVSSFNAIVEHGLYLRDDKRHDLTFEEWKEKHSKFNRDKPQEAL